MAGKNVEDELGTVDDTPLKDLFNVALLRRAEIVIEEKNVGVGGSDRARDFLELTRTNQGRRVGTVPSLQNLADHGRPRALGQGAQLRQRLVSIELGDSGLAVGLWRSGLHCSRLAGHGGLCRDRSLSCDASARTNIHANQKGALAFRFFAVDFLPQRHTPGSTPRTARFLAVRTSQTENPLSFGARSARGTHRA